MNRNIDKDQGNLSGAPIAGSSLGAQPQWWTDSHNSRWERVKEAFHRDWEQTKADFSKRGGQELDQDVDDTVRQAFGSQEIPPEHVPNVEEPKSLRKAGRKLDKAERKAGPKAERRPSDWNDVEPAMRYGYGARAQYRDFSSWDDRLEAKLRSEWSGINTGRSWDNDREYIRRGWDEGAREDSGHA